MADALVLAAGKADGRLAEIGGSPHRALIEVAGRTMVERVLAALRGSRGSERIVVVAPREVQAALPSDAADIVVTPGETLLDNVNLGLAALGGDGMVLFAHADAPLVTPVAIDDFLDRAEPLDSDLAYAIVPKQDVERLFPHAHRTYGRVREGIFTGTNLVLVRADFIERHRETVGRFCQHRKNLLHLAAMLGPGLVLRLLSGRLSIAHVERRIGQVLGGEARAVVSHYAELAFDVDKPADLEAVRTILAE